MKYCVEVCLQCVVEADSVNEAVNEAMEQATTFVDYVPRVADWDEEDKCFYFFDNGYGWSIGLAKKYLKRKDCLFWNVHNGWCGEKIRSYLINEFELEGFKKEVGDCSEGWTEIVFRMIGK